MQDSSHEFSGPSQPLTRESGEAMQAFVGRHRDFFILLAVMLAQLLLLSVQITRNHNVRLIQEWTVAIFTPFQKSAQWVIGGTRNSWRHWSGLWSAQQQNAELRGEIASAKTRLQELSARAKEAESLRALLDLKKNLPMESVAADVIGNSPGEHSGAIFIDKGSQAGLTPGLAVITPEGVVGKIVAVFPYSSQVLLITDPSSGVGCMLEKTGTQGVLRGGQKVLPELRYIRNEQAVAPGDRIVTSGLDQIFPRGFAVGTILQVSRGDIFQNVLVQPAASLDRLESVLVAKKPFPEGKETPTESATPKH
jgi:rod shape-determining protein MreC